MVPHTRICLNNGMYLDCFYGSIFPYDEQLRVKHFPTHYQVNTLSTIEYNAPNVNKCIHFFLMIPFANIHEDSYPC